MPLAARLGRWFGAGAGRGGRLFDRVIMVDWSAAGDVGPAKPSKDRCWLAWGTPEREPVAEYYRTRHAAERRLRELVAGGPERTLIGCDFPYGYPRGSGLGGGRALAARLDGVVFDHEDGANNRFEVAAALNAGLDPARPGPFWGCPPSKESAALGRTKPSFAGQPFGEHRIVEQRLRARRLQPRSCWQLYGAGSVGGQVLLGLSMVHRLLNLPEVTARSHVWPFETDWDARLGGIIHAEIWPGLVVGTVPAGFVRDEYQVKAMCVWALERDGRGELGALFARPPGLDDAEATVCEHEEGWILGVR